MVPVYGTTLVEHRALVLRGDQKVFDGFATLEVSLDAISTTNPFDTFTKTLCVGYDNVTLTLHCMVGRLGRVVAPIIDLSGRPVKSFLHFVQGPFRVVTFGESFPEVLLKLINILKGIKTKKGLGSNTYKSMYPTGCVPPKFYGLPKIHKPDTPLRPIVSSCGSVTYGVAKELAKILKPLVGKSPHHIHSTQDFVEQAKHFKLEAG